MMMMMMMMIDADYDDDDDDDEFDPLDELRVRLGGCNPPAGSSTPPIFPNKLPFLPGFFISHQRPLLRQ